MISWKTEDQNKGNSKKENRWTNMKDFMNIKPSIIKQLAQLLEQYQEDEEFDSILALSTGILISTENQLEALNLIRQVMNKYQDNINEMLDHLQTIQEELISK